MDLHCPKCLTSRTGDVLGAPCRTLGCDGIIQVDPPFLTLVDVLPEPMTCGRRHDATKGADRWQKFKRIDNRVCSYCGSLHPDDMFRLVKECAEATHDAPYRSVVEVSFSDKSYKIYVHQPGVRNAHEGGIKFYTHHLPRDADGKLDVPEERQEELRRACASSRARFEKMMGSPPHEPA